MVATSSKREESCHHGAREGEAPGMVILPSIEIHSSTSVDFTVDFRKRQCAETQRQAQATSLPAARSQ